MSATTPASPAISSSTPILDREIPVPAALAANAKTKRRSAIILLVIILVTAVLTVLMIRVPAVSEFFLKPAQRIQRFLDKALENTFSGHLQESTAMWRFWTLWLAIFPVIAVHELGHAIACKLVGFRIVAVRVKRLQISPPFRIKWVQKDLLPGASGVTLFVPNYSRHVRRRALAVFFAGPLANLISAFAVIFIIRSHIILCIVYRALDYRRTREPCPVSFQGVDL